MVAWESIFWLASGEIYRAPWAFAARWLSHMILPHAAREFDDFEIFTQLCSKLDM
jgi:hypothetical protein